MGNIIKKQRSVDMIIKKIAACVVLILLTFFFDGSRSYSAQKEVITVASASSFSYAMAEIKDGFEDKRKVSIRLVFGSSGLLSRQIQGGAPFDVFISANSGFMDRLLRSKDVRSESVKSFARGALVLVVRNGAGYNFTGLSGLLDKRIRRAAIANPAHAPYGRAAVEALKKAGLFEKIRKKLVYGENVRQAMQFVESGNADAGFIAFSIAPRRTDEKELRVLSIDPSLYNPIEQCAAIVSSTAHGKAAGEFINYLTGPAGMKILKKYGFQRPLLK